MELTQLLNILRRRWLPALLAWLVVVTLGAAAAFLPADRFTADVTLLAQPNPTSVQFGQIQVVEFLMSSLESTVMSDSLEADVRDDLPAALRATAYDLGFANEPGTGVFEITVESERREATAPIANAFSRGLLREQPVSDLLLVTVIDPATTPTAPSAPARLVVLIASFVLGLVAAVLAALLFHALRRRRVNAELLQSHFGTSLVGELPSLKRWQIGDGTAETLLSTDRFPAAVESYQRMRSNVELLLLDQPKAIAVTSLYTGEGKSTVTALLGWSLASAGNRVTIIDADLRRPTVHKRLGEPFGSGLGEMREGVAPPAARRTRLPNLEFYAAGTPNRHPAEIITSALPALVDHVERQRGRLVLIDAPPLVGVAESNLIAVIATAVIIVVDSRRYNEQALEQALDDLQRSGTQVLGVVLNRAKFTRGERKVYEYYAAGSYPTDADEGERVPVE